MPLKFGHEVVTHLTAARIKLTVIDTQGRQHVGWGETPLSANWAWPDTLSFETRMNVMQALTGLLAKAWASFKNQGHPLEVGHAFIEKQLPAVLKQLNAGHAAELQNKKIPTLAALVTLSAFDIALHDAYGQAAGLPIYETYNAKFMNHDLSHYLKPAPDSEVSFEGKYPEDFLSSPLPKLLTWHLVGGLDPLDDSQLTGTQPNDGYPITLKDWIAADGLKALKIKLRGNDSDWDYQRIVAVGKMAIKQNVDWLTTDFNCTVMNPEYVNVILDKLRDEHPRVFGMLLYVEQPFPYELEEHPMDVRSVSARKPLFMDESAHDWTLVQLGRSLGWTGVALKTCKTQTGALLSLCWARAHGMTIMVQDLTNTMLAQIPHVQLASHANTIGGVESNGMQFCPAASAAEAVIHPGIYQRRDGVMDLSTLQGAGFGYRIDEINRELPESAYAY